MRVDEFSVSRLLQVARVAHHGANAATRQPRREVHGRRGDDLEHA